MGIKTIFILLVILALGFFLVTTESGKKYLSFLQEKFQELTEAKLPTITTGKTFITLSLPIEELEGKTFTITNSSFKGYGRYKEVLYEKTRIESEKEVSVSIQIQKGKLIFKDKNARVFALTKSFELGDIKFSPETPIYVSVEIFPFNFTLSNILEEKMDFNGINGELRGAKGTVIVLEEKNIAIEGFFGDLTYINQTVTLSGNVTKILINGNDITNIVV